MFISVKYLQNFMGVDQTIGRFFVDRRIPTDNAFWSKRLLYISRGNGFVSIPVYYDLLWRIGIPKEILLEERHVVLMERIMHYAIQFELEQITFEQQIELIKELFSDQIRNPDFFKQLTQYLAQPILKPLGNLGMEIPALNRADVFLFILCDLPMTKEQTDRAIVYWYALHPTYLLMDDIYDYQFDKQNKEENAIVELGDGEMGSRRALDILQQNAKLLAGINQPLSTFFAKSFSGLIKYLP